MTPDGRKEVSLTEPNRAILPRRTGHADAGQRAPVRPIAGRAAAPTRGQRDPARRPAGDMSRIVVMIMSVLPRFQ